MATTTLSPNLKLRISSDLSDDSKFNLNKLDSLGSIYQTDTNQLAKIRSLTDILIQPQDPDIGGSGSGGIINLGSTDQPATAINLNATTITLSSGLGFSDQGTGGDKSLFIAYNSTLNGAVDTTANRTLSIDLDGADRQLILGGNLQTDNSLTFTSASAASLTLPLSGTLSTLAGSEALTNKVIDATANTISEITNTNISNAAAISGSKILPTFGAQVVSTSSGVSFTNGIYSTTLQAGTLSEDTTFTLPVADGTSGQVLSTDGLGNLVFSAAATATLAEDFIRIGNSSGEQEAVDTNTVGEIAASTAGGLAIKSNVITNSQVNVTAGIELTKLATLTASTTPVINASGFIEASAVTSTELGYLSGVTSALQTQLDAKVGTTLTAATILVGNASNVATSVSMSNHGSLDNAGALTVSGLPTSVVSSGTFADARISETSVTQHEAAINHDSLTGFVANEHLDWTVDLGGSQVASENISAASVTQHEAAIDHDSLTNFSADEHVAHSSINITAGTGLTGGGTIASSRVITLALDELATISSADAGDYIAIVDTSDSDANRRILFSQFESSLNHDNLTGFVSNEHLDWTTDLGGTVVADENISSSSVTQHAGSSFKTNWTQVDGATKAITHNLGTLDIQVELYDTSDGATILADTVVRTDTNTLTLTGENLPATFDYRVLIKQIN